MFKYRKFEKRRHRSSGYQNVLIQDARSNHFLEKIYKIIINQRQNSRQKSTL